MAGISGFDDLSKDLNAFVDNLTKLDGLSVNIEPTDTVAMVEDKIRIEIRQRGVKGVTSAELRNMAQDMHGSAQH